MGDTKWTKEQELVINLRNRNILVSAAAGSGKTAVLVERIIQIISCKEMPVDIDRLLVVTFTKAAAAEMRNRVGTAIERMLMEHPGDEHLQRQATLLHNAQITTIDSFCQNIIRNYFHVIDLDPAFRVADENELAVMKTDIMEELLEDKYLESREKGNQAFLDFTESFSPGRTDSAIEKLVLRLFNISMSYPWPEEWLDTCLAMYGCSSLEELEETTWMKELKKYIHDTLNDYMEMAQAALEICNSTGGPVNYCDAIESDINQIGIIMSYNSYSGYYEGFGKLNPARLSAKKDNSVIKEKREAVKSIRESYQKGGLQVLKKNFFYQPPEEMLSDIKSMYPLVKELINLVKDFSALFAAKKREEGILDFADMEHFALNILVNKSNGRTEPSEVALELQEYYEEVMTDEYQDSNFVQELILTSLCRAPQNQPYLFMVGDVKQSIYQFRLARPELFMQKYNSYTVGKGPYQRIDLHMNFRSRKIVIDSVNYIFEDIMKDCLGGINYDNDARLVPGRDYANTNLKISEKTDVLLIEQKSEDTEIIEKRMLEAAAIGNSIREMVQGSDPLYISGKDGYRRAEYRDIVILLRSVSGWSEEFIETLSDMGIPAYSDTKTGYFSAIEVCTVLDFLRIIDNPGQDIPLVAVMRSVIGNITDEELACIAAVPRTLSYMDQVHLFIKMYSENKDLKDQSPEYKNLSDENLKKYMDRIPLSADEGKKLAEKLETFCNMLSNYQDMSKYSSVYEILQCIYKETGYYSIMSAMPAGEKRAANLDILLQKSIEFTENGHRGIFGFTHYIERLNKSDIDFGEASVNGGNANAVRIMSIHKSKGLQFPVVFVAGMGKQFNLQDARKSTIIDADYGVGADYINLEMRVKQPVLMKKFMANQIKRNTLSEEIRILYVALTRAEEKLVLTGTAAGLDRKTEKWKSRSQSHNMASLLSAQTYFDWIMPVILRDKKADNLFNIIKSKQCDIITEEKQEIEKSISNYSLLKDWDIKKTYDMDMLSAIKEQIQYTYTYSAEQKLSVKVSVTEMKRTAAQKAAMLAGDEDNITETDYYVAPKARFMKDKGKIQGTQRGTLYHLIMEHLPYDILDGHLDFDKFISDMCDKGYMTREEASVIDKKKLVVFARSNICRRMCKAQSEGRLKREQPFIIGLKASEVYEGLDGNCNEIILMQGIIDAFFEEDNQLVIIDYKTDFVKKGNSSELIQKYGQQLSYYTRALENITGKKVKEKIIYSFALGMEVYVP
ncbi:MAG TPA: helicase-exonuclease AddAB subunit AddA [Lachnospiraceae bacterium]|nr:helicase-exonuclease AddAB subunit AddA [Lachnospiraceae bacterium]